MFISKNVGRKEGIARVVAGAVMILCGLAALHATAYGLALAGVGLVSVFTGASRYCPACAIAGRKPTNH